MGWFRKLFRRPEPPAKWRWAVWYEQNGTEKKIGEFTCTEAEVDDEAQGTLISWMWNHGLQEGIMAGNYRVERLRQA